MLEVALHKMGHKPLGRLKQILHCATGRHSDDPQLELTRLASASRDIESSAAE